MLPWFSFPSGVFKNSTNQWNIQGAKLNFLKLIHADPAVWCLLALTS